MRFLSGEAEWVQEPLKNLSHDERLSLYFPDEFGVVAILIHEGSPFGVLMDLREQILWGRAPVRVVLHRSGGDGGERGAVSCHLADEKETEGEAVPLNDILCMELPEEGRVIMIIYHGHWQHRQNQRNLCVRPTAADDKAKTAITHGFDVRSA